MAALFRFLRQCDVPYEQRAKGRVGGAAVIWDCRHMPIGNFSASEPALHGNFGGMRLPRSEGFKSGNLSRPAERVIGIVATLNESRYHAAN